MRVGAAACEADGDAGTAEGEAEPLEGRCARAGAALCSSEVVSVLAAGPVERTEEAAAESAVRFLLDGLGVTTIRELHALVEAGRVYYAAVYALLQ